MTKDTLYFNELLERYVQNKCNPAEVEELLDFLQKDESNRLLLQKMNEKFKLGDTESPSATGEYSDRVRQALIKKIEPAPVISMRSWPKFAVAAAIIVILLTASFFILNKSSSRNQKLVKENNIRQPYKNDVAPGGNKAVLMLADGSRIILDSVANGTLAQEGNVKVLKLENGQLAYQSLAQVPTSSQQTILYNAITTPRGGQYQVTLSDGSKVWLNASSSLRFPNAFVGKERVVEIEGEAYFEIKKNASMPFKVRINPRPGEQTGTEVEVLGTHFNINSYNDEPLIKTTLLEGSIKLSVTDSRLPTPDSRLLKPGQQAQLANNGSIKILNDVDVDHVTAWKNGLFDFNDDVVLDIMRQLSRWYDVEIFYSGNIPDGHYVGSIRRAANISEVLRILEVAGGIQFSIEGKKIVVKEK